MLKALHLQNFRGFADHTLPLRRRTLIVGANNAGKSTVVEALRLISLAANRSATLNYSRPPYELGLLYNTRVISPSLQNMDINYDNLFYQLGDPPASVKAEFAHKEAITAYIGRDNRLYATVSDSSGNNIRNKSHAASVFLPEIHILPQVAPLARDEKILTEEYVRANVSSGLAPLHFRNQLRLFPKAYAEFKKVAEDTWPGLKIRELVTGGNVPGEPLGLLIQDGTFVAEAAWMGHGLQMWLQTVWFLARTPKDATVILDEPDVYLHPDLQHRLFRLVCSLYPQVIIATHSLELMSEADPHDILIIDRTQKRSHFADDQPAVQRLVDHIGSSHNVNLARLHASKLFILVEGKDLDFLNVFHSLLADRSSNLLASIPHLPLGGWGGWDYAIGSTMTLQNYVGGKLTVRCFFDSDYHTPNQIAARYEKAQKLGIHLHIWSKKEIENYLLIPEAISRVIRSRMTSKLPVPTPEQISAKIDEIAEDMRQDVVQGFGSEFSAENKKGGFAWASQKAEDVVKKNWATRDGRWSRVSGSKVLSALSEWAQNSYGVSFGPMTILREIKKEEVPNEIAAVIQAVEKARSLVS